METVAMRKHREAAIAAALSHGIDISPRNDKIPAGTVAVYSYSANYKRDDFINQVITGENYARQLTQARPIHFHDGGRHVRSLLALIDLAKRGVIKAVVFKDVKVFKFCLPQDLCDYLKALRDAGTDIHFADVSFTIGKDKATHRP